MSRPAPQDTPGPSVAPGAVNGGVAGRRTVTIKGRGAERYTPTDRKRPNNRRPYERDGFKPDRAAMWAVLLGVVLILVAVTSSHAVTLKRAVNTSGHPARPALVSTHHGAIAPR